MSRIGKKPVLIPKGVKVSLKGNQATISGPKGELKHKIPAGFNVNIQDSNLVVKPVDPENPDRALWGLTRTLLGNMVIGVTQGYARELDITGVGYKAAQSGEKLSLQLGFTHSVDVEPPPGIKFELASPTRIKVSGIDKALVGEIAARIRRIKIHDSYKGKGLRYAGEKVRLKPGKAGKAVGKKK